MSALDNNICDLKAQFHGEVLIPGEEGYDQARAVWNAMIDRHPRVIARCRGTADVIDAVNFARDNELALSIRGGGHNVAGYAVCDDGLMIDLSLMRSVRVDPRMRRAYVAGGALWSDVDRETQAFGLATPGGLISDTGVAGLTLSGGVGSLRAKHGLTIDNLLAADVVTADGNMVRASDDQNTDLLWALKGGGGNFGAVVSFEFALHECGPEVAAAIPIYPLSGGPAPIRFFRDFLADKNHLIGAVCEFSTVGEDEDFPRESWGEKVFALFCVYNGDPAEGEKLMQPLREQGPLVTDFSGRMRYTNVQKLFDAQTPAGEFRCYWKSRFLAALPDEMIDIAMANAAAAPSSRTISSFLNFGGATADVAADATAFGDRTMKWWYSLDAVWPDAKDDEINIAWSRDGWKSAEPFAQAERVYLNFTGHGEDDEILTRKTFGDNYQRLTEIKAKYDPGNLFSFNQNIKPAA